MERLKNVTDVGAAATRALILGTEMARAELAESVAASQFEHAPRQLLNYALRLVQWSGGLGSEEVVKLVSLVVDVHSLFVIGLIAADEELLLREACTAFRSRMRRNEVSLVVQEISLYNPHGADWWFPRLFSRESAPR